MSKHWEFCFQRVKVSSRENSRSGVWGATPQRQGDDGGIQVQGCVVNFWKMGLNYFDVSHGP